MNQKALWTIAIVIGCLYSLTSLSFSILNALNNVNWETLSAQSKFTTCLTIFGSWGTTIMAYLSTRAAQLKRGEIPTNGGTDFYGKTANETKTETK